MCLKICTPNLMVYHSFSYCHLGVAMYTSHFDPFWTSDFDLFVCFQGGIMVAGGSAVVVALQVRCGNC